MEEMDKIDWYKFVNNLSNKINRQQYELICILHAKYYNHSYYKPCTCNPKTIKTWIAQLNDIYEANR
jgi:hypothetical protein